MKKYSGKFSEKEQIKIAIVAEELSTKSGSRAPIELAKALARKHKVSFFAYSYNKDEKLTKELERSKIEVIFLPNLVDNMKGKIINTIQLAKVLRKNNYDVISSHCLFPLFFALWFSKKPIVSTYYGLQQNLITEKVYPKPLNLWLKFLEPLFNTLSFLQQALIIYSSQQSVAISNYAGEEVKKIYRKRIPVVHLGAISSSLKK